MSQTQVIDQTLGIHLRASKYYMLASVVILYFDYLLTFDLEIRYLRKRWTAPMILFYLNRYYPMLVYVVVLRFMTHLGPQRCERFKRFPLLSALASEAVIGIIVMLRLYALYARSMRIIYVLFPLYAAQLMLGAWAADAVVQATGLPPSSGCIIAVSNGLEHRFAWLWCSSAVFDTLVFGLTMYRVLTLQRRGLKLPLTTLFLRDGLIYYAVMFSARLLNFILFWTAVTPDLVTLNWTFNNTITVIMINRLVLNLRQETSKDVILIGATKQSVNTESYLSTFVGERGQFISTDVEPKDINEEVQDVECEQSIPRPRCDAYVSLEEGKG